MAEKSQNQKVTLEAVVRNSKGKGAARSLRREGSVPGVVYGERKQSLSIQVLDRELGRTLHTKAGGNVLINLSVKEGTKKAVENLVLIKELQTHPVTHHITHVDFHQVSLTKRITVTVPLAFKGEAAGVKSGGGILEHIRWDIEVECLPTEIPAEIAVDVSKLEVGQALTAQAISLPSGVRLLTEANSPIVACEIPKQEELLKPEETEAQAAEPEVIKQKKPEEAEGAEGAAPKEAGKPAAEKAVREKKEEKAKG